MRHSNYEGAIYLFTNKLSIHAARCGPSWGSQYFRSLGTGSEDTYQINDDTLKQLLRIDDALIFSDISMEKFTASPRRCLRFLLVVWFDQGGQFVQLLPDVLPTRIKPA